MGVDLSPDLRHAKVFVSAMGTDRQKKESMEALTMLQAGYGMSWGSASG
jgi:ribosome-binding factor A